MKRILFYLSLVFVGLTFAGAVYVIGSGGTYNAGYAVVPMAAAIACAGLYRKL